ncbi:MAG: outer membrane lipoprotein carrier protein LolA [Rhodospirillales bacterium]
MALFLTVAAAFPAAAATPVLPPADQAAVTAAERSLNDIRTLEGRFTQSSSEGGYAHGKIYVRRPGRLRLDYAPPTTLQVYGDGFWLIYVDTELKDVQRVPIRSTPAGFLVRDKVSLSDDVTVTKVERAADRLRIHLVQADDPSAGTVVLSFAGTPPRLTDWEVIDPKGVRTRVTLVDTKFNVEVGPMPFVFDETPYEPERPKE